jgi:signal transduction histidine kinase
LELELAGRILDPRRLLPERSGHLAASEVPQLSSDASGYVLPRRLGVAVSTNWFRAALCLIGIATAPLIVLPVVRSGGPAALDAIAVLTVLVGWSFVASGFVAWDRRPENRVGALLLFLGLWWTAGHLMQPPTTSSPLVYTVGEVWPLVWTFGFVLVLLSFPGGRLTRSVDRLLAGAVFFAAVPLQILWLLFHEEQEPRNAFLVWPSASTADAIDTGQRVIWLGVALVLVATVARRWVFASPPLRRTLAPVLAGGITVLVFSLYVIVSKFRPVPTFLLWSLLVAYTAVPVALLASMLRARLARSSVADLFVELRAHPPPADLRDALARTLRDPSLTLAYWLPQYETYADLDGQPVELPEEGGGRATTFIDLDGERVAALLHDQSLRDELELLDAVSAAAGIALENARLQSELRARLEELRRSRARILEAAQTERRRLERDLHDGAQQRLVSLSLELGLLEARLDPDPATKRSLARAQGEVAQSLQELREIARGIHPAVVGHGLRIALESLVARVSVPVRLSVELDRRLPEAIEMAAYYVVAESLTNVAKYARSSGARVDVAQANGELAVEVVDDGVGGANTERGSGLRGLADRVEALGGRLRVWSPSGGGTRVRAEIPCG